MGHEKKMTKLWDGGRMGVVCSTQKMSMESLSLMSGCGTCMNEECHASLSNYSTKTVDSRMPLPIINK